MPIRLLAPAIACALALAACGGEETTTAPDDALTSAVADTSARGTARFEMDASVSVLGQGFSITADGVIDNKRQRARMNLDLSVIAEQLPDADPDDFRGEQIVDGYILYLRIPAISDTLGGGKPWVRMDLRETQGRTGSFDQLNQTDPAHMLPFLEATTGDIQDAGGDEVNGVETTHYKAKVDLRKYPDVLPPDQREGARASIERLIEKGGSEEIDVEAWVDADNLVRRMKMYLSIETQGQDADVEVQIDFLEFGVPGNFEPPPPSEVGEAQIPAGAP